MLSWHVAIHVSNLDNDEEEEAYHRQDSGSDRKQTTPMRRHLISQRLVVRGVGYRIGEDIALLHARPNAAGGRRTAG